VVASRTVITRTRSTMAVVTLEDLQGSIEVVVFPRLYEQTGPIWQDGAILLVAGRVDHRGEEVSLLADIVVPWEEAVAKGPEAFGREVAAGDRGAPRRRQPVPVGPGAPGGTVPVAAPSMVSNGNGHGAGNGHAGGNGVAGGPGRSPVDARSFVPGRRPDIEYISPLRGGAWPEAGPLERSTSAAGAPASTLPRIAPADPVSTYAEPPGQAEAADHDVEPALPDEARSRVAAAAAAATDPVQAGAGDVLYIHLAHGQREAVSAAMQAIHAITRERPGETPVVIHLPVGGGSTHAWPLNRRVAYDAELLAEVRRRLGSEIVELRLGGAA
jgi:hypothetical protein